MNPTETIQTPKTTIKRWPGGVITITRIEHNITLYTTDTSINMDELEIKEESDADK